MYQRAHGTNTTYHYSFANGTTLTLTAGENGISETDIAHLLNLDRIEENNARRDREHLCALTEFVKGTVHDNGDPHTDPIEGLADLRWAPETVVFTEEHEPGLMDCVEEILPRLSRAQQELFRLIRLGYTEGMLASHLSISRDAVKSRRRYLYAAIRRQLEGTVA